MRVIVGLGNPGEKYKNTRHNVGFDVLDMLALDLELEWQEDRKRKALIAKDNNFLLIKPLSYMNLSGEVVKSVLSYYKILPKSLNLFTVKGSDLSGILTVVHDDLDIDFGKYKISLDSRSAGHNGVQSIINHLKTKNFNRYRIGIRNEQVKFIPAEQFVLQRFNSIEKKILASLYTEVVADLQK